MLKRSQPVARNYSRDFALRDLEFEQEIAAERRRVARARREALLRASGYDEDLDFAR